MEKFSPSSYHSATAFFSHCSSCICFAVVAFWIRYLFLSLSHFWGRVMWCFGEKRICTLKKKDEKKISSSDTFCLVTSSQRAWELHNKDRFYFCYWKLRSSLIILSGCEYPGSFVYLCFSLPSILAIADEYDLFSIQQHPLFACQPPFFFSCHLRNEIAIIHQIYPCFTAVMRRRSSSDNFLLSWFQSLFISLPSSCCCYRSHFHFLF